MAKGSNEKQCTMHALENGFAAVILSESEESSQRNYGIVKNRAGQGNNELHRTLHELSADTGHVGAKDPSPCGLG